MENDLDSLPESYKKDFNIGFNFHSQFPDEGAQILKSKISSDVAEFPEGRIGILDGISEGKLLSEREHLNEFEEIRKRNQEKDFDKNR